MVSMQPATINARAGQKLEEVERDSVRASEVRNKLN
jgi:protein-arginine kinase